VSVSQPLEGVRVGAVFPQTEIGNDRNGIARFAARVQELGFQHILAYDHVLSGELAHHPELKGRYNEKHSFHEVLVLFGYLAAIAPDLEMVTGVIILPQRQTALVAKQAATLDVLTGGRTRLGVGIGWNDIEYQGLGENFRNRARRFEEQVDVLRTLWRDPIVTVQGQWHTIDHAGLAPLPIQRPIPIWFGGSAEAAIRRAARLGDGFMPNGRSLEIYEQWMGILRDELRRIDRDPGTFGVEPRLDVGSTGPEEWKREFEWWRVNGMTHLTLHTMGAGFTSVDQHLEALERALETLQRI
jgi:probable F420-dependent oxidoreductase